jgi:1,2-diacylglycerol 3-alpha-glucosyltransferase
MPEPTLFRVVVIWIDWYPYHVARLRGLLSVPELAGRAAGIELVGGIGVHSGLRFREQIPACLPVRTLMPEKDWRSAGQLRLAGKLWRVLREMNPEAVLVPGYYSLPALVAALWARTHRRTSILMTESTAHDHRRSRWKEASKAFLLRALFDSAVAGGRAHVRYLDQLGFRRSRVAHYYDVVDNSRFTRAAKKLRKRSAGSFGLPGSPYFLYVGRIAPEKNLECLVAAWEAYRNFGGTWPLLLVGDGPSLKELRLMAARSPHAAAIHFAGHKGSAELPAYYAFAGCFVLPSTREPWGLVVNEAMASGLPVLVSSRCGSAEDLVEEGGNGFTFAPKAEDLTAKLVYIAALSDAQRRAMGARSQQIIASYSPHNFGVQVQTLLRTARA